MKKLKIDKIDGYNYVLIEEFSQKIYIFSIEFYDMVESPKENDFIYIHENLLDKNYPEYSTDYCFGALNSDCGRDLIEDNQDQIIIVVINHKKIYLQRLFG